MSSHRASHTRLYNIYDTMKRRCYCPNHDSYKHYGAKGVVVCEEWLKDPSSFINWARTNGYNDDLTLDRIAGGNSPYCPENCRWVTWKVQANNKSDNRIVEFEGVKYTIAQFVEKFNISRDVVNHRLKNGWSIEKILKVPIKKRNKKSFPINGVLYTLKEAAKIIGIPAYLISSRLYYGWTPERIVEVGSKQLDNTEIEYKGKMYGSIADLSREYGMNPKLVRHRIERGWTVDDAITRKPRKQGVIK